MNIYQVIYERFEGDKIIDVIEYIMSVTLILVAESANNKANEMGWELKQVRYLLTVTETIKEGI